MAVMAGVSLITCRLSHQILQQFRLKTHQGQDGISLEAECPPCPFPALQCGKGDAKGLCECECVKFGKTVQIADGSAGGVVRLDEAARLG